jgi:hypothetical protein
MTLGMQVLAMMAPFAGLAVLVLAFFAVSAWTVRRTERLQLRGRTAALHWPPPLPPAVTNAELRRWARSAGLQVADRGPMPAHVREAWSKAHR